MLLNQLLGGSEEEPLRFIDLAARVTDAGGLAQGVLGFHVDFAWAEAFLAELANNRGVDLFLVNEAGEVIVSTDATFDKATDPQVFRTAAAGVASMTVETWPDGETYFATVIPAVRHGDLPSFGWRMVARIAPTSFDQARADLVRSTLIVLLGAGAVLVLMTAGFNRWFLRPIGQLAANANRIAAGADEYPFDSRRTAELAALSAALARLQSKDGPDVGQPARKDRSDDDRR